MDKLTQDKGEGLTPGSAHVSAGNQTEQCTGNLHQGRTVPALSNNPREQPSQDNRAKLQSTHTTGFSVR